MKEIKNIVITVEELEKMLDITKMCIYYYLDKFNIPRKGKGNRNIMLEG